jgi:molybdopterin-guanine dinucleotide biosynthesis protein
VEATRYSVYITAKQWKKVAEAIADPEDVLIVEGFPMLDAQRGILEVNR